MRWHAGHGSTGRTWPRDRRSVNSALVSGRRAGHGAANVVAITFSMCPALVPARRHCCSARGALDSAKWLVTGQSWPKPGSSYPLSHTWPSAAQLAAADGTAAFECAAADETWARRSCRDVADAAVAVGRHLARQRGGEEQSPADVEHRFKRADFSALPSGRTGFTARRS
jgi:hypothetical protein